MRMEQQRRRVLKQTDIHPKNDCFTAQPKKHKSFQHVVSLQSEVEDFHHGDASIEAENPVRLKRRFRPGICFARYGRHMISSELFMFPRRHHIVLLMDPGELATMNFAYK